MFDKLKISNKELILINKFKKIFKQEMDCDDIVIELVFECIKDLYLYFKDYVDFIPKELDPYNYYVFKGNKEGYTLLEFLLNRVAQNIEKINCGIYSSNQYDLFHKEMGISKNRYDEVRTKYSQSTISMFFKKSIYHETIHAIQSNPILIQDKNEFVKSANNKTTFEQKQEFYDRLKKYNKLGIKINDVTYNQLMDVGSHVNPRTCSESINEYRSINEASVEMLAVELSGLRNYVENLNTDEKLLFYELSRDQRFALLISNPENGYKYNSHFVRLLLKLVGRKNFFFEFFTQRNDLFLYLKEKGLVEEAFEENLRYDFMSTEGKNCIDTYYQIVDKHFGLCEVLDFDDLVNWVPLRLEENNKNNKI